MASLLLLLLGISTSLLLLRDVDWIVSMADGVTPRINSAMLPKYIGRTVRLTAKVIKVCYGVSCIVRF